MTDRIHDERILFYIRHQELITTWAAVRRDLREEARQFYLSLADDLAEAASGYGEGVAVWTAEGSYSKVGLYLEAWDGEEAPLVLVCLEWHRQATFTEGERLVGLRVRYGLDDGKSLRPYLGDSVRDITEAAGFGRSSNYWPAFRTAAAPEGDYWDDLSAYRSLLLGEITSAWHAFREPADVAIAVWRAQVDT